MVPHPFSHKPKSHKNLQTKTYPEIQINAIALFHAKCTYRALAEH